MGFFCKPQNDGYAVAVYGVSGRFAYCIAQTGFFVVLYPDFDVHFFSVKLYQ